MIRIDARELHQVLELTPPEQNILLVGKHGIGKSEMISHFYHDRQNLPVIPFFLGQMSDPGDLIGLLHKDEKTGRSVFLPPYWWPEADRPVVLFLDELNRARPEILQAVQDLTLNKTLAGKPLPPGSIVIAAVNAGEEYQLTELDPALVSRFNLYEFAPTVEDWLLWAADRDIDSRVLTFIQQNPEYLDGDNPDADMAIATAGLVKTPDRRAWAKVADFVGNYPKLEDIHFKLIAGMVGTRASIAFRQSLATQRGLSPEQLLLQFAKHSKQLKDLEIQDFASLNERVLLWLNSGHCPTNKADNARKNLLKYLQYLQKAKQQEAIAHFSSLVQGANFSDAMGFVAESMDLIDFLSEYLEAIKV
ncbi:AAA family ATPase [Roseofilum casamattae]|uniref:AAA family ATPase n=1 Tax=Roseofilum casamattae BLCC-M143 TaxID=3022442 RepID=A0ABT7C0Z2_9CYAN|nr:AAA family ATPase [Roseofilum casamattae]MDJ1184414.1 AAA family ATPase [Roseofilum casamattae BLCC-M143]